MQSLEIINQILFVLVHLTKQLYWGCIARVCLVIIILHIKHLDFASSF